LFHHRGGRSLVVASSGLPTARTLGGASVGDGRGALGHVEATGSFAEAESGAFVPSRNPSPTTLCSEQPLPRFPIPLAAAEEGDRPTVGALRPPPQSPQSSRSGRHPSWGAHPASTPPEQHEAAGKVNTTSALPERGTPPPRKATTEDFDGRRPGGWGAVDIFEPLGDHPGEV
jgi:hypothetical protein